MTNRKFAVTVAAIGVLGLLAATSSDARISGTNYLRFSKPVALPGVTLAAGEYTFEAAEGNPDVVRVRHRATGDARFLGFTRSVARPAGMPDGRLVTFGEAKAGSPPPVAAWYESGSTQGHQFIYENAR